MNNDPQQQKTILVIYDVSAVLMYLNVVLSKAGHKVIQAETGIQGLKQYEERKDEIDLILLDLQLPDITGFEIAAKIRETDTQMPIIAQTALALEEEKANAMNAGCTDIILKPLDLQNVREIIEKYT